MGRRWCDLRIARITWCAFRDQQLQDLRADCNTWLVVDARPESQGEMLGVLGCYVDDILITGSPEILQAVIAALLAGSLFADCA